MKCAMSCLDEGTKLVSTQWNVQMLNQICKNLIYIVILMTKNGLIAET